MHCCLRKCCCVLLSFLMPHTYFKGIQSRPAGISPERLRPKQTFSSQRHHYYTRLLHRHLSHKNLKSSSSKKASLSKKLFRPKKVQKFCLKTFSGFEAGCLEWIAEGAQPKRRYKIISVQLLRIANKT